TIQYYAIDEAGNKATGTATYTIPITGNITLTLNETKGWIIWQQRLENITIPLHSGVNWISIYFKEVGDECFEDGTGIMEEIGIIQDGNIIGRWHFYDPWLLEGFREGWDGSHETWKSYYDPIFKVKLEYNDRQVIREESIHYNNGLDAGFETIQSFAITTSKVSDDMLRYWLNREYPEGVLKAAYGTFLTALAVLWLHDRLADEVSGKFNCSWTRTSTIIMCGVSSDGRAYVHAPDPGMGMFAQGDDVKSFRFTCSLILSEIERVALESTGLSVNSTLAEILSGISEGKVFEMIREGNIVTIMLEDNPNSKIVIDTSTGLAWDLTKSNGFWYKGALSRGSAYCYHEQLTNNLISVLPSFISAFGGILLSSIDSPEDVARIILSRLGLPGSLVGIGLGMYVEGKIIVYIRNRFVPREYWRYIAYHPQECKVIARLDPNDHTFHYIEVPLELNGYEKWDEAVYI
ncbi:MAG: hypothetical protein ACPLF9_08585, partial [Methanothermobacter tenebrarum]